VIVLIPAHNEEQTIGSVIAGLRQAVPDFDRLVINDGSSDGTASVVDALGEKQLRLVTNLGYGAALQAGMEYALLCEYDAVITIDADGQHQAEDVPKLFQALVDGDSDMVIGSRFSDERPYDTEFSRRLGQQLFSHLARLLIGYRIFDTSSGFKAINAEACRAIVDATFMDFHIETIVRLSMLGFRIVEVPVTVLERSHGQSMHSVSSIFNYPLRTLVLTIVAAMDVMLQRRTR
jgi:glycosyltransferase involved in cell wall biosynthesis